MKVRYGFHNSDNSWSIVLNDKDFKRAASILMADLKIEEFHLDDTPFDSDWGWGINIWYDDKDVSYRLRETIYCETLLEVGEDYLVLPLWSFNDRATNYDK